MWLNLTLKGSISPEQSDSQPASQPHNWLVGLVIDLAALCNVWRWKWYQLMLFDCFQFYRAIARHFVASHKPLPPPTPNAVWVLVVLATSVKELSKMVDNSASYPFNSWHTDELWITWNCVELHVINCLPHQDAILQIVNSVYWWLHVHGSWLIFIVWSHTPKSTFIHSNWTYGC